MRVIDSHLHVWDPEHLEYPWLTPVSGADRSVDSGRGGARRPCGFGRRTRDPRAGRRRPAETAYLLEVAAPHPEIAGVVGYVPLDEPERAAERLAECSRSAVRRCSCAHP